MNFYQNNIWRVISKEVFNKDIFEVQLFGKKYWGIKKTHKKFWLALNWFQVLGIYIPSNTSEEKFKYEIESVKKDFSFLNNIFFQFGFINKLSVPYYENRLDLEIKFETKYWLYSSVKENMPLATVTIDLTKPEEEIYKWFSKSAKRNINKAIKNELYFEIAKGSDIEKFYDLWNYTAKLKWFNIYPKNQYLKLINFLKNTKSWDLYLVKKDDTIISGSIEINENNYSYYLYWATNRDYIKIGGHYFLKWEMFKYLKKKWIKKVDLLWVAPEGFENHHLKWVSQFKHSLGWEHIEYFWNYDLPLNNFAYKLLKKLKR
jgi:lipid II:glycine glycyltransferase (peptidoglycan interpeptide bridge formation enzyme)